jgi:hypothetical protein
MRPVAFGESLPARTRLTLFSDDKPESSGIALKLRTGVPSYQVEDEEGRTHLLIHLPVEEDGDNNRWCLWRPDQARLDSNGSLRVRWWRNKTGIHKNALKSD